MDESSTFTPAKFVDVREEATGAPVDLTQSENDQRSISSV